MGIAVRRGRRRGPLLQGRKRKKKNNSQSVWNVHGEARCRPSIIFLPQIASLFFHFTWLYDVKMLLLSHVSSLVLCLCHECVRVCMYVRAHGFPTHGVTHGVYGVGERVCVHLPSS